MFICAHCIIKVTMFQTNVFPTARGRKTSNFKGFISKVLRVNYIVSDFLLSL